jgi:predicted negative regulator of RcsB-dependent stress response
MNVATILQFAKKNWKEILIVICLLLVIGKMRYDYRQLESAYITTQESLQNQIEGLQEIHKRELEKREEALREYEEQLADIEKRYEMDKEELDKLKRKKHKEFTKEFVDDPELLAGEIQALFGFDYVE